MVSGITKYLSSPEGMQKVASLFPELVQNGVDLQKTSGIDNVCQAVYLLSKKAYINRTESDIIRGSILRLKEMRDE
jgi:hypothetical protein